MADKNERNKVADIARLTGVSSGTVSNALNNRKGVSEKKRQEILEVAQRLGYARTVHKRVENALRFVIYKRHGNVVDDTPFFSQLIKGIETESRHNGFDLLITHVSANDIKDEAEVKSMLGEGSAGLLLLATEMLACEAEVFSRLQVPVVVLDNCFRGSPFDSVLINNFDGAYKATRHLIDMGHRDIGIFHSSYHINNFYYRRASFYEVLRDFGIRARPEYEISLMPTMEGAYKNMCQYLEQNGTGSLPTAFFAENDIIGLGAMRALQEAGVRAPEDVSIIGFDDMPYTEVSAPRLSTVRVMKKEMGQMAVDMLVQKINDPEAPVCKNQLCTELVMRDSVKKIANACDIVKGEFADIL